MALKIQSYKYVISIQIKTLKNYLQCLRIMKDFIYFKQNIPNVKRTFCGERISIKVKTANIAT